MNRIKFIVLTILAAMCSTTFEAVGRTATSFFTDSSADVIFARVDNSRRLDMVDYFNAGLSTPTKNAYGGDAVVTNIDSLTITFTTAEAVETTLNVLVNGRDTVLMVIDTYKLPQLDSRVKFYDTSWLPVYRTVYNEPDIKDWLVTPTRDNLKEVTNAIKFMLVSAEYNPATSMLTLTNNTAQYFLPGDKPEALDLLRPSLQLIWSGGKFKLVKQ
jgi:hypothetical protein